MADYGATVGIDPIEQVDPRNPLPWINRCACVVCGKMMLTKRLAKHQTTRACLCWVEVRAAKESGLVSVMNLDDTSWSRGHCARLKYAMRPGTVRDVRFPAGAHLDRPGGSDALERSQIVLMAEPWLDDTSWSRGHCARLKYAMRPGTVRDVRFPAGAHLDRSQIVLMAEPWLQDMRLSNNAWHTHAMVLDLLRFMQDNLAAREALLSLRRLGAPLIELIEAQRDLVGMGRADG